MRRIDEIVRGSFWEGENGVSLNSGVARGVVEKKQGRSNAAAKEAIGGVGRGGVETSMVML